MAIIAQDDMAIIAQDDMAITAKDDMAIIEQDDMAIIAQDEINLKRALENLDDVLISKYKMKINRKKTEVMVCSKDFENIDIKMDDPALKYQKFKYLGSTITEDGKNREDIRQRIREAKIMFN